MDQSLWFRVWCRAVSSRPKVPAMTLARPSHGRRDHHCGNTAQDFGVTDAILLGGSGDVSMWVTGHESHSGGEECFGGRFVFGGARKGGTRRGIFPPGERPLNCVLVAYLS